MFGKRAKAFLLSRESQSGQALVLVAISLVFLLAISAVAVDGGKLYKLRRDRQNFANQACLSGAIGQMVGANTLDSIVQSLKRNGVDIAQAGVTETSPGVYVLHNEGTGNNLTKGIEIGAKIRVALSGEDSSVLAQFAGWNQLVMGAIAICQKGLGGPLSLVDKEFEDGSKIISTSDPNDTWSGWCPDQSIDPSTPPSERTPANCFVWGDEQVLAGDGHVPNDGGKSMNGLIAPDVRCNGAPGPANKCTDKVYIPPIPDGVAVNTLKSVTMNYICSGYNGAEPVFGTYSGVTGSNVAQMEGVSNNFLVQQLRTCVSLGDLKIVMVYANGDLWDGNKNFDYVELIGYAVVRFVYFDANTAAVVPVYPLHNEGDLTTMRDDLPQSLSELASHGFSYKPLLLMWGID